jgi:hypothetical protein
MPETANPSNKKRIKIKISNGQSLISIDGPFWVAAPSSG